jgi:hypothetical protein
MASRSYYKGWQDKRPGWRKRAKWFQVGLETTDIRINFVDLDEGRECNRFYNNYEAAQADYGAFMVGHKTVLQLMEEREHGRDEDNDSQES